MLEPGGINTEIPLDNTPLQEVQPIRRTQHEIVRERSDLESIVEFPLLPACLRLYDLNIETFTSSANHQDLASGYAQIGIDFGSLSTANQTIARETAEVSTLGDGRSLAYVKIPLQPDDTISSVQRRVMEVVEKFKKQKMSWATVYTLGQVRDFAFMDQSMSPQAIADELGLYFDPEQNLFYLSQEQYEKAKEKIEE